MEATRIKLPGIYAIIAKEGEVISLDDLSPEEAYARLEGDKPLTIYTDDLVVTFKGGYIAALDTLAVEVGVKKCSPEMAERLLKLIIDEDASYDGVEEFFSDFPVRFVP